MVGWHKGCTIVPLRESAVHFEDLCVFCNLFSRCALALAQGCPLPNHESSQLNAINGPCIDKLGGLPGSFVGRSLVWVALFDISIWHIDCRYIDTFENIDKYWIDSKLAYRTGLGLRHNQRACPIGHQLLSRGAQMCNFGNSSSGWFEMQKSLMFCRLYWQRTRLAPVLIILWFDTLHNGSVVN